MYIQQKKENGKRLNEEIEVEREKMKLIEEDEVKDKDVEEMSQANKMKL